MYSIMSTTNSDSLTFSSLIWIPFPFSSLIPVARTSKTMLNKSGESGHSCLVPDLRGNTLSFSPLHMIAVCLSYIRLYYVELCTHYAHFLESFDHKWVQFFQKLFLHLLKWYGLYSSIY